MYIHYKVPHEVENQCVLAKRTSVRAVCKQTK